MTNLTSSRYGLNALLMPTGGAKSVDSQAVEMWWLIFLAKVHCACQSFLHSRTKVSLCLDIPLFPADYPEDSIRALRSYIESLPTQTAILTATQSLIRLLLLYTAYSSDSSHLALGTSLTSLSINLISSISQGGGFVVREEAEEQWTPPPLIPTTSTENGAIHVSRRRQNVRISRPLRDVGMKECAAWAWWSGLKVIGREKIPGGKQGIGGLTRGR